MASDNDPSCIFYRRSADDVEHLIAGPGVAICDGCLSDLSDIMAEQDSDWRDAQIERLSKSGRSRT
jgi:ATP-dependent protease Clp ATPase subunit